MGQSKERQFTEQLKAYEQARAAAVAATHIAEGELHKLVYDARERGLTWRDIAVLTGESKSTLARGQRTRISRSGLLPMWLEPDEYMRAVNHAWRHAPSQAIPFPPFEYTEDPDGTRHYRRLSLGVAQERRREIDNDEA